MVIITINGEKVNISDVKLPDVVIKQIAEVIDD